MIGFAASFVLLYVLGVRGSWAVSELLPASASVPKISVQFHVPSYIFWVMLTEMALMFLWAHADCIAIADARIHDLPHRKEPPRALCSDRVTQPDRPERVLYVRDSRCLVGSVPACDITVGGKAVLPQHLGLYLRHGHDEPHHFLVHHHHDDVCLRTFDPMHTALLNDSPTHMAELKPGDVIEVGDTRLELLPIQEDSDNAS